MAERKTIYLCLAHMSEEGIEQKYVKEAFDTNWVVPMGPNVNAFEKDLERFINDSGEMINDNEEKNHPEGNYHLSSINYHLNYGFKKHLG